mgnify:CR=1 FL=1
MAPYNAPTNGNLIVTEKAIDAADGAISLVRRVPAPLKPLADQVIRSAASVPANLSEGHGRSGRDRIHHWRIAFASAKEVDSHLRLLVNAGVVNASAAERTIEIFRKYGDMYDFDPLMLAALAYQESGLDQSVRSRAGAVGVMQLLPSTARLHSRALGLGSRPDLEDPAINIRLGARELATLIRKYGALEPALAAYNAGERRVRRWWRRWPDLRVFSESVPIPETYSYIRRVVFLSDAYLQMHADARREHP